MWHGHDILTSLLKAKRRFSINGSPKIMVVEMDEEIVKFVQVVRLGQISPHIDYGLLSLLKFI